MMRNEHRTNTSKICCATMTAAPKAFSPPRFTSETLLHLSDWLWGIQEVFLNHNYEKFYIGGSSAREILDHVLFGSTLDLRDLDIYLIKGGVADPADVETLATEIESLGFAGRGKEKLRPKIRANAKLPKPQCYDYVAGFGAHMFADDQPILSLGIFNGEADLELNGLFNIDNIFLCLSNHASLAEFAQHVYAIGPMFEQLRKLDLILDKHFGYDAWCHRKPKVLNWIEIERAFARHSLRVVRSYAKASRLTLSDDLVAEFQQHNTTDSEIDNVREFGRGLIKIFADHYWAHELKMLAQLGVLRSFSSELEDVVRTHSTEAMQTWAVASAGEHDPLKRACERATSVLMRVSVAKQEDLLPQLLTLAPTAFGAH